MSTETDDTGPEMSLIVRLNGEAFAIPVRHVHEVIHTIKRTRVPNAPAVAPWLINVRGSVVPLVDVRKRLQMPQRESEGGRIVVLDVPHGADNHRLALLADDVEEVMEFDPARIEPIPQRGAPWPAQFLRGSIRRDADIVMIIQPETLFEPETGSPSLH